MNEQKTVREWAGINRNLVHRSQVHVCLFLLLFMVNPAKLSSQSQLPDTIKTLWARYKNSQDDSTRVVYLSRLAFFYNDYFEDKSKSDSLGDAAILVAELSRQPGLLLIAYNNYLESTDNAFLYRKSLDYASIALQKCRIAGNLAMQWRTSRNLAQVYLSKYDYTNALIISKEALQLAMALKDRNLIAESYLIIGKSYADKNQKIEAFKNFLVAREMAENIGDPTLLKKCYSQLSRFYNDNKLFEDAVEYKNKEVKIILVNKPVDSVALMWAKLYKQFIRVRQKKGGLPEQSVRSIIGYSIRTRNDRLKAWEFGLYRKFLLESDELAMLYNFFKKSYPDEFANLYQTDREMYFRITAYFKELEKKPDSARYFFDQAEHLLIKNNDKGIIYLSNFYNRFGQFLIRHDLNRPAIEKFTRAYQVAEKDDYPGRFEYMLIAAKNLEALYKNAGDYKNAWHYASVTLQVVDSISKKTKSDQIMAETVRMERLQKEADAEKNRQKIRQGENQVKMLGGGVVFFIIVTLLVYRNFRNQKRLNRLLDAAKKQSDHLLLNILPHETAEELKSTGKARAKRFDEVTVMFTDFKDFTQASERMSAEELVDVINFYFTEFDNIISRHNIEKIKIIGDSYMCAGGLPAANTTHACDVVAAALEFQEFMMVQAKERRERGESFFELRIGIHSGPVVAGIVGLKKFAYDIWGDTVNTASRMENASESNKVNISGATFEKVKELFNCTYRGKVTAKHKGEIDMYFVNSPVKQ